ncbi:MAG TPA: class I SAM-dependent methyltransferase [Xenococcaceae cyanobacterium]
MKKKYSNIRRQAFFQPISLDIELIKTVNEYDSHKFLRNSAGQNIYLYLTLFIKMLSEYHFSKPIQNMKILDWGCGKGHVSYFLNRLGAKPISCDIKSDASDSSFCQQTPIIDDNNIFVIPLSHEYELPFEDESIDIILSFGVLEHVSNDFKSLEEINRILKIRGLFCCFNLPYKFSWTQNLAHLMGNYYHDRLYSKSRVDELLNNTGFELLDLWYRQLFPKNSIRYPWYQFFESLDQSLTEFTLFKYLATNIEFVASKFGS